VPPRPVAGIFQGADGDGKGGKCAAEAEYDAAFAAPPECDRHVERDEQNVVLYRRSARNIGASPDTLPSQEIFRR
jgi:hypothetical protein